MFSAGFPKDLRTDDDRFQNLQQIAQQSRFELKESEWLGINIDHRFTREGDETLYEWTPNQLFQFGFPKNPRSKKTKVDRFNDLKLFSEQHGYELLEVKWLGNNKDHRFRHIETGEEYVGSPNNLNNRNGFPLLDGQRYLTQEVCRQAFVHIFGGRFKTNRNRLKEAHGSPLELDGYEFFDRPPPVFGGFNESTEMAFSLQHIAFEFQGHQSHRENQMTIERDLLKVKYCKQEGILLVPIDIP